MKNSLFIALLLISMLSISGCWDMVDIDKRFFVGMIGIDKEGADYSVTLSIPKVMASSGQSSGQQPATPPVIILKESSKTIYGAIEK
ncbi:MAG: hypothetical protein QME46_11590, partial [Thermoanaerobacteraceae bacterium]|nr:hypothetical protein [Thermoanaerobacteraceae bacterium]